VLSGLYSFVSGNRSQWVGWVGLVLTHVQCTCNRATRQTAGRLTRPATAGVARSPRDRRNRSRWPTGRPFVACCTRRRSTSAPSPSPSPTSPETSTTLTILLLLLLRGHNTAWFRWFLQFLTSRKIEIDRTSDLFLLTCIAPAVGSCFESVLSSCSFTAVLKMSAVIFECLEWVPRFFIYFLGSTL